jgi:hypothetical protein
MLVFMRSNAMDESYIASGSIGRLDRQADLPPLLSSQQDESLESLYAPENFTLPNNEQEVELDQKEDNEEVVSDLPLQLLSDKLKGFRAICKLCSKTPKRIQKHLQEVHCICSCAQQYGSLQELRSCQQTEKHRIIKNPQLLKFISGMKKVTEANQQYECDYCEKTTYTKVGLNSHKLLMHYICFICNTQFTTRVDAKECKRNH